MPAGRYFKYAIGEIVLVVIGILIALWINNQNQERIKEENLQSILVTIQDDLLMDAGYTSWLINRYIEKDTLKNIIFSNQMDYDNLSNIDMRNINFMSFSWSNFRCQDNGYKQLMANVENVPQSYKNMIKALSDLYVVRQGNMDVSSKNSQNIVERYKTYLGNNEPWYAQYLYSGKASDAQIDYYKNNPKFKSHIMEFYVALKDLMWAHSEYRETAMETYVMINDILGDKARDLTNRI